MTHTSSDMLIIGGGIIGLMTAKFLSDAGHQITILDRQAPAQESSWAGGGILSPLYPWQYDPSVSRLARWGHDYYPSLAQTLTDETHIDPEHYRTGLLIHHQPDELAQAQSWAKQFGYLLNILDEDEAMRCEPHLKSHANSALWLPEIAHIRNPRLTKSLIKSLEQAKVNIVSNAEVTEFEQNNGLITGVKTASHRYSAEQYLVATGAWTANLLDNITPDLPVYPMKGQMLLFKTEPGEIKRMVLKDSRYIIPRKDGHTLFGSTLEKAGFDKTTTEAAKTELSHIAYNWFPVLKTVPIVKHWSGLRPGSPAGIPTISRHPELSNLFINTGHFRNGVILGAGSAKLASNLMLGEQPILDPAPYALN